MPYKRRAKPHAQGYGMGAAANAAGRAPPDGLFRVEALQAQRDSWLGEIHIATPPRRWIVVCTVIMTGIYRRHAHTWDELVVPLPHPGPQQGSQWVGTA